MEQWLWRDIEKRLNTTTTSIALSLQTLSSIRSLITNSTTSDSSITVLIQTLTVILSGSFHHQTHLHIISLLSQLSLTRPHISYSLPFTTLLSSSSPRLTAATLSLLLSIPAFDFHSVDHTLLISLSFRPCISVRVWFLHNAASFNIQPNLLLTVFLGFTKDPYPNVREAALMALLRLCQPAIVIQDSDVVDLCYFRAVHLLSDPQDYVRQAAVRCAGEWGRMIATLKQEGHQRDWFDFVFLQICSTVRDMNVKVRVEAFTALGKFTCVSEDILLQALSKKVLVKVKDKQNLAPFSARQCKIHVANAAGAFIHGLEDEFNEVQQAACVTLRMIPVVSGQFAGEVFNIVSYVLNDDSIIVRLEALKTLHHMAVSGCLKMQEEHIEMLLGTLVDNCLHIRSEAIRIIGSVKLPSLKPSKMTVESLLECLDMYPKSEANIFRALFGVGQNNGDHSVGIVDNFDHEAGEWGRMIATLKQEGHQRDWFDFVFLQICSTVRDMNVKVRVEAFTALGKFTCVSEDILLQAPSKKVLVKVKDKQNLAPCSARQCKIHVANAAGAFIHGLEDEFNEVQQAACVTLRMIPVVSGQFAGEVFNIVSYVLNDDSIIVRLEALKTLHHMAVSGCLKMQEEHIEMLLGTLVDNCLHIRSEAIRIIGSVKLPSLKPSKMTVESLLECLDMYPKSEANIFRALFGVGQNNGDHSVGIVDNFDHEVEPCGDGKFGCNNHRVAGLIVLAVSASLKHENFRCRIPQNIFSYAAAFFGRISHAFADIIDADSLLQYLSHCGDLCSEAQSEPVCQPVVGSASKDQLQTPVLILDAVNFISASVTSLWGLVKSGCTSEVLRALRCCKGSLRTISFEPNEFTGAVAFVLQYIHIVKLITKIWENFVTSRKCNFYQIGQLDILFAKLEGSLLGFKFRFIGLEKEDELYILELILLSYVMVLSSFHMHCTILLKLSTTITLLEDLRTTKSTVFSDFLNQISDSFKDDNSFSDSSTLKKLRDSFVLRDFTLSQRIKQVKAELVIIGSDSVTPLRFIPGLPVGVPLEMTLYNVTSDHVLWLKLTFGDDNTEFVFLDIEEIDDLQEMRQVKFSPPFYGTPRAKAFTLRVSIGIECKSQSDKLCLVKGHGGPEHALTYISPEMDVYFVHY
ncbi:protein SIEL-like isoform X2 [Silene latifolia]|uniref:protein SIEL-like isoform X2 n=1 Tax=Silene latifolia TaxID=37657 RepID=UPI003D776490